MLPGLVPTEGLSPAPLSLSLLATLRHSSSPGGLSASESVPRTRDPASPWSVQRRPPPPSSILCFSHLHTFFYIKFPFYIAFMVTKYLEVVVDWGKETRVQSSESPLWNLLAVWPVVPSRLSRGAPFLPASRGCRGSREDTHASPEIAVPSG